MIALLKLDQAVIIAEKPVTEQPARLASIPLLSLPMPPLPTYRLSDFDFVLPPELIAQAPLETRSASRLLHVAADGCTDLHFRDLPRLLRRGDLLVVNDTQVIRSRLHGAKASGGKVEVLIERLTGPAEALAQVKASHAPAAGSILHFAAGASARVKARDDRFFLLRFDGIEALDHYLEQHGEVPLPPYIRRRANAEDATRYQSVYAREPGAVAAPTAGLHFDTALLARLARHGVKCAALTLHVGAGTFQPVQAEDLAKHRMHSERLIIPNATASAIAATRSAGRDIVAVGTTVLRALESCACGNTVAPGSGETSLFITPGYRFKIVDRLLTNFHLPKSTLLMLVSAFAGFAAIRHAYAHAIAEHYRFYSYGDAMLLDRAPDLVD